MRTFSKNASRRGAVLICVLACILVSTTLAATTIHATLRSRREHKTLLQLRQTEYLLEAGVKRAISSFRKSREYTGETWHIPTSVLGKPAAVTISVQPDEASYDDANNLPATNHIVEIDASIGSQDSRHKRIQRNYRFIITQSIENSDQELLSPEQEQ